MNSTCNAERARLPCANHSESAITRHSGSDPASRMRHDGTSSQSAASKLAALSCKGVRADKVMPGSSPEHQREAPTNAPLAASSIVCVPTKLETPAKAANRCATAIGISSPPKGRSTTFASSAINDVPPKHSNKNGAVEIQARKLSTSAFQSS